MQNKHDHCGYVRSFCPSCGAQYIVGQNYCSECGRKLGKGADMESYELGVRKATGHRCKDCRFYTQSNEKCELVDTRLHFYETDKIWTEDCFCSWGERRSE